MDKDQSGRQIINDCLCAIKMGDVSQFQPLFSLTAGHFTQVAKHHLINKSFADDVVSDAFLHICTRIHTYNTALDGYSWMYRIVVNCAKDYNRHLQKIPTVNIEELPHAAKENNFANADSAMTVEQAIATLDDTNREIAILRYYYDMTLEEIGKHFNVGRSCISQHMNTIKKHLEKFLKK